MIRPLAFLVGLFFAGMMAYSAIRQTVSMIYDPAEPTAEHEFHLHPRDAGIAGNDAFGKFDRAQLQRGYQVYKTSCASCHGMRLLSFRDLAGIGYSEGQIKTLAGEAETAMINPDNGEPMKRKSTAADRLPSPYANEAEARNNNNKALPPDLSLITKARHDGGNYVYSLLTGYQATQPERLLKDFKDATTGEGQYYNPYFANLNISMPPPLVSDGQVPYSEGNPKPTIDQMAKDVSAFLVWTAEPKQEIRKQVGFAVMAFLLLFTLLAYMSYQNIWADKKKR